jgi:hypothetical protein
MKIKILALVPLLAGFALCAGEAPAPEIPAAPAIPADLQQEIAWDVVDANAAQLASERANAKRDAAIAKAQAICGAPPLRNGAHLECPAPPAPAPAPAQ